MINLDSNANWCLSGGAQGADLQWGMTAGAAQHGVIHFSFAGHRTAAPASELAVLSETQLQAADPYCRLANQTLKRRFPAKSREITNLLRRNWYQVEYAGSLYGISAFDHRFSATIPHGTVIQGDVIGGTAWAVEQFKNRFNRVACPCYVFDQVQCQWFQWNGDGWRCINQPPKPLGIYAAIGSRKLLPMGKLAIRVLMNYPPEKR